jgi:uncharacterized delta-60 repeat protein
MRNLSSFCRVLAGAATTLLLSLTLAVPAARAQCGFEVTATPVGPLTLCAGGSATLTATATLLGFNGAVQAVLALPDGKVLAGGTFTTYRGSTVPGRLVRLNADGSLDGSFNAGGTGFDKLVTALALEPDGQVLVGGAFSTYNGADVPDGLVRLHATGSLDASFNSGGAGFGESRSDGQVKALALEPDGQVLVGGSFTRYNGADVPDKLVRLNANGSLDTGFNSGGTGFTNNFDAEVVALVLEPDGQVLAGGQFTAYNGTNIYGPLVRLNANGSRDFSFFIDFSFRTGVVLALALEPDGQVLVGGFFEAFNMSGLVRLNADGSQDQSFNPGGTGFDTNISLVFALAVEPDGQVLVGGQIPTYNGTKVPGGLVRLNADGSLDASFNGSGAGLDGSVLALALGPDGQVLAGGGFSRYNGTKVPNGLLRLNANGSVNGPTTPPDISYIWSNGTTGTSLTVTQPGDYQVRATSNGCVAYGNTVRVNAPAPVTVQLTPAGPVNLPAGGSQVLTATATRPGFNVGGSGFDVSVNAVLVQPDGKVLVGGSFNTYNGVHVPDKLVRLNADGSRDATFNTSGFGFNGAVYALALAPDGKVLVGGSFTTYIDGVDATTPNGLVRLNADGSRDTGFNAGNTGFNTNDAVYALALEPDGQVLAGGRLSTYNGVDVPDGLVRLNANGSRDTGFNGSNSGFAGLNDAVVYALALAPDGRVLVGGSFTTYNGAPDVTMPDGLVRLNADGSRDISFNGNNTGFNSGVYALALQPDGLVLAGGDFSTYNGDLGGATPARLVRLNTDGSRDKGFNGSNAGFYGTVVHTLALEPDGQVLVGGDFSTYNGDLSGVTPDGLVRLNVDGSRDTGFNASNAGSNGILYALALAPDGQVLAGGNFTFYNGGLDADTPDRLVCLNADGSLNNAATAVSGATFVFNPGATTGSTRTVSTAGTYTATATDPATGCTYTSNAVVVTGGTLASASALTAAQVRLYPNPAGPSGSVQVAFPVSAGVQAAQATVRNALGQVVFMASLSVRAGQASGTLATAGLAAGVYVVRLQAGSAVVSKRLMIE